MSVELSPFLSLIEDLNPVFCATHSFLAKPFKELDMFRTAVKIIALVLLFFCVPPAFAGEARAVVIGIDKYSLSPESPKPKNVSRGTWMDLDGAVADAQAFREILISRYAFDPKNIHLLTNEQATRSRVLDEIKSQLLTPAKKGDVSVFFYAGHGSQRENSLSPEPDQKDETIVPSDANQGIDDIRDKELRELFSKITDKEGVTLTIILDSCHSGSAARGGGKARRLEPDMRDIKDGIKGPTPPEDKGALVLSAAQDVELAWESKDEKGNAHGRFSLALLRTLRTSPNDSAEVVFRKVRDLMLAEGGNQEPVLAGNAERKKQPLFGGTSTAKSELTINVHRNPEGELILDAGQALSVFEGCQLSKTHKDHPARIEVTEVLGLGASKVKVIEGDPATIESGDSFKIDRWVVPSDYGLNVWVPPSHLKQSQVEAAAAEAAKLKGRAEIHWVTDPAKEEISDFVTLEKNGWKLYSVSEVVKEGKVVDRQWSSTDMGKELSADQIQDHLKGRSGISLYMDIPPSEELVTALGLESSGGGAVLLAGNAGGADYCLTGSTDGNHTRYAWVVGGAFDKKIRQLPLPLETVWLPEEKDLQAPVASLGSALKDRSMKLARIKAWLTLQSPPDDESFPYKLALKRTDGKIITEGSVQEGEAYGLALLADPNAALEKVEKRWVYVFTIDNEGRGTLLFPTSEVENKVPYKFPASPEIDIGPSKIFRVGSPFGTDTYILLASQTPLGDATVLEFSGVKERGGARGPAGTLDFLLSGVGSSTRGSGVLAPADWSVQRLSLQSLPKEKQ